MLKLHPARLLLSLACNNSGLVETAQRLSPCSRLNFYRRQAYFSSDSFSNETINMKNIEVTNLLLHAYFTGKINNTIR